MTLGVGPPEVLTPGPNLRALPRSRPTAARRSGGPAAAGYTGLSGSE
jgi:hypothetical protein